MPSERKPGAIDPVCGMTVDPASARYKAEHAGQTYYFCSESCQKRFVASPPTFLQRRGPYAGMADSLAQISGLGSTSHHARSESRQHHEGEPATVKQKGERATVKPRRERAPAGPIEYICPMHPEVVRNGPGSCPKCGMDLEPRSGLVDEDSPESSSLARRFWISLVLTVPLVALAMGHMFVAGKIPAGWLAWIEFALATPVVLWGGWPILARFWQSLASRSPNMFTLIGIGTIAAYAYSTLATFAPGLFPPSFRSAHGEVDLYFEAAAAIVTLVLLGQWLEQRARSRTGAAIRALVGLAPKTARRIRPDGTDEEVPLAEIEVGDRLRVRPGERVPTDGLVVEGTSFVDESMISGEAEPVEKTAGTPVIGGTVNGSGGFVMEAARVGADTVLAQIVALVQEAQRSRAPIQRLADVVSGYFVPAVILAAVATFAVWAAVGPSPRLAHALVSAVAVLIIACPCALGLATPMSIMVGMGRGAQAGVLFKNAEGLELMEKVDMLVLDKTGTLTQGKPEVVSIVTAAGGTAEESSTENELVRLAASVERASEHPLAAAVVKYAAARGLPLAEVRDFRSLTGQGVQGLVEGKQIGVGNRFLSDAAGGEAKRLAEHLRGQGQTTLFISIDGRPAGILGVADPIKPSAAAAVRALAAEGIEIVMLTGDRRATAAAVARRLGIGGYEAELLPKQKLEAIERLKAEGHVVAMAGDGINDAPALSAAHVGIAMGTGTDVAMESADVTLLGGDLLGIVRARRLSRATMRNIRQNLFFALVYNALAVPVAAGVLYPFMHVHLSPMIAAATMSFSSVSVIGNALRLRRVKLDV